MPFWAGDRKVYVSTGSNTQTINICTAENSYGRYEYSIRLAPQSNFTSEEILENHLFPSQEELLEFLWENHQGKLEKSPFDSIIQLLNHLRGEDNLTVNDISEEVTPSLSAWEQNAKSIVEETINQLILEFIDFPYLHRREHSIHCELYKMLSNRRIFGNMYPMSNNWFSQPVHKEWPENIENDGRRGAFDLCIISPRQLQTCSFQDFKEGRITPIIGIEIGLDYELDHLRKDERELLNSGILHGYLVHLVRQDVTDNFAAIEDVVLESRLHTAYAHITNSLAFYKLIHHTEIKQKILSSVHV